MQDARAAAVDRRGVSSPSMPSPPASTPIDLHAVVVQERVEQADGVGAAADAATTASGSRPSCSRICARASRADHRLEVAHHRRIGVRAGRRADQVVGVVDVGDPVAQGLVHGVLERRRAGVTGRTSAPSRFMRKTLGFCRSTSAEPM